MIFAREDLNLDIQIIMEDTIEKYCKEIGAEYKQQSGRQYTRLKSGNYIVILEKYATRHSKNTRVIAPYKPVKDFEFRVFKESLIDKLVSFLGMQDIIIGHEEFDKTFIVEGNDADTIKQFLNGFPESLFTFKEC